MPLRHSLLYLLAIVPALPYAIVFLAYRRTLMFREDDLERVVKTGDTKERKIPDDVFVSLQRELRSFYSPSAFWWSVGTNIVFTIILALVSWHP